MLRPDYRSCTQNVRTSSMWLTAFFESGSIVLFFMGFIGGAGRARTDDPRIMSPML